MKIRQKLLKECIDEEEKEQNTKTIKATTECFKKKSGGLDKSTFQEFQIRLKREKNEPVTAMIIKGGNKVKAIKNFIVNFNIIYSK